MKRVSPILGRKSMHTPCNTDRRTGQVTRGQGDMWLFVFIPSLSKTSGFMFWAAAASVLPDETSITSTTFLRARRTSRTTPALPALFLIVSHSKQHFFKIEIITDPHQNCARGPHHEARDEALHTCAPSQGGGFIDGLRKREFHQLTPQLMSVPAVQVKAAVCFFLPLTRSCRLCAPPHRSAPILIYPWPKILQAQLLLLLLLKKFGCFLERQRKFAGFLKSGRMNNSRHVAAASSRSCQVTYLAGWMTAGESRLWGEAAGSSHSDLYSANHVNRA